MRYVIGRHRKDHGQTQEMQNSLFNIAYEKINTEKNITFHIRKQLKNKKVKSKFSSVFVFLIIKYIKG